MTVKRCPARAATVRVGKASNRNSPFTIHHLPFTIHPMAYGWEGEKVRLVPLDKEKHAANVVLWLNDPDVTETILSGDMPLTPPAQEEFFERIAAHPGAHPT